MTSCAYNTINIVVSLTTAMKKSTVHRVRSPNDDLITLTDAQEGKSELLYKYVQGSRVQCALWGRVLYRM